MSLARRMRRNAQKLGPAPVVEITPRETHMHFGALPNGEQFAVSVEDATLELGYMNVEVLTAEVVERVQGRSQLTREYFDEAIRLDGVYSHDSDSVLFVGDRRWMGR